MFETIASADSANPAGAGTGYRNSSVARTAGYPSAVTRAAPTVVIAEDEALIRLDLKEMLIEEGYDVIGEAGDGGPTAP